jgi:hypothetical protein
MLLNEATRVQDMLVEKLRELNLESVLRQDKSQCLDMGDSVFLEVVLSDGAELERVETMVPVHGALTPPLVFHEFVHVEQYRQLGVDRFAELYVKGFLERGCYEAIPLEVSAYGLEGSFRKVPNRGFSVEQEVAEWLHRDEEDEIDLLFGPEA